MKHVNQWLLIGTFVPLCWLAMMAVHELGHILAGWLTGGTVVHVVLHPLAISRTDVQPNPHPLIVVWAGPLVGIAAPLLLWGLFRVARFPGSYLPRYFAGFCLIANGAYIGIGSFARVGDAGEMLRHGTPILFLWLFGLLAIPLGLQLWHRLGPSFGFGASRGGVDPTTVYLSLVLLLLTLVLELALSSRA